jgi:hypothetical protein
VGKSRRDPIAECTFAECTFPKTFRVKSTRWPTAASISLLLPTPIFCARAIKMIYGHNNGRVSMARHSDLLQTGKVILKEQGGAYLWWECSDCRFRVMYHVSDSQYSTLQSSIEIRAYPDVPLEYRAIFLAKSHLQPLSHGVHIHGSTHGCVFCFAEGHPLDTHETLFSTEQDLAIHISATHSNPLPSRLMLTAFRVAVNGELPADRQPPAERFEVNIITRQAPDDGPISSEEESTAVSQAQLVLHSVHSSKDF